MNNTPFTTLLDIELDDVTVSITALKERNDISWVVDGVLSHEGEELPCSAIYSEQYCKREFAIQVEEAVNSTYENCAY
jgi:hypothetical protein